MSLNYGDLLNKALRGVVKDALIHARLNGLGDDGCFHITFKTRAVGVSLPDFLKVRYPDVMTIALQWQFSNLNVSDTGFGVTLQFDGRPFYIQIPFAAITEFKDLSTEFMLTFTSAAEEKPLIEAELPLEVKKEKDQRILSMDEFRKKRS